MPGIFPPQASTGYRYDPNNTPSLPSSFGELLDRVKKGRLVGTAKATLDGLLGDAVDFATAPHDAYVNGMSPEEMQRRSGGFARTMSLLGGGLTTAVPKLLESAAEREAPGMVAGAGVRGGRRYAPLPSSAAEVNAGVGAKANKSIQTVNNPKRMMYPGIYGNPKDIVATAAERLVPEDPALKRLWGVNRGDLDAMAAARGPGRAPTGVIPSQNGRGAQSARDVMTRPNAQRLVDVLGEAGKVPGLAHADAWYVMDPLYQRMEQMFGPEEAVKRYGKLNTMMGMASPGSDVLTEAQRGSAAHWLESQGRFADFVKYGGVPVFKRGEGFPDDMRYLNAHPYHSTSQALPMQRYLDKGELRSEAPKVPLYVEASGVPQTGFQWNSAVGDAHYSRGVGLADTRIGPTDVGASFSRSEHETLSPWFRDKVAAPLGIQAVPAQARTWTVMGPQTGVESPLGQGKLELLSHQIMKAADRLGVAPEKARDMLLSGEAGAGMNTGMGGVAAGVLAPATQPDGQTSPGNINLNNRPMVKNPDGSTSTVRTMGYTRDDGSVVNIPTVSDEGTIMQPQDAMRYWGERNQNLGVFSSEAAAEAAAQKLHEQQAIAYSTPAFNAAELAAARGGGAAGVLAPAVRRPGTMSPEEFKRALANGTGA